MPGIPNSAARLLPTISTREEQLLALAADGHTDAEIAKKLGISLGTVNVYWTRLRSKLGARSRTEAVALVLRQQAEADHRRLERQYERVHHEKTSREAFASAICALVDGAPDGILVTDGAGRLLYVNSALADLFGYDKKELVGAQLSNLIPDRYREEHRQKVMDFDRDPEPRRMGKGLFVHARKKDGSEFVVCVTLSGFRKGGETSIVAMVRDYSQELEAMRALNPEMDISDLGPRMREP